MLLDEALPEFQEFLILRNLASPKNAPFYAYWVGKFLAFSNKHTQLSLKVKIYKFMEALRTNKADDWKIKQAELAIGIYTKNFLDGKNTDLDSSPKDANNLETSCIINKLREIIRLRHYSYSTERTYLDWVKRFFNYLASVKNKTVSSQILNSCDVKDYLTYLAVKQRVSSSTQNQAFNALLFLFRDVLKIEVNGLDKTVRAKRGSKLPIVLTVDEVKKLFENINDKNLLIVQLLYGSGLRLMEVARLRIKDIDFDNGTIVVRSGKQDKDRVTMLPSYLKEPLQKQMEKVEKIHEKDLTAGYGETHLPDALSRKYPDAAKKWGWQYIFPARNLSVDPRSKKIRRHHIHPSSLQKTVKNAARKAGLIKNATVHTLRHSFATHLLMNGVNLKEIQELPGHKHIETTMIYTHVLRDMSNIPKSPLDNLYPGRENSL